MKTNRYAATLLLLLTIMTLFNRQVKAQVPDSLSKQELYITIAHMDSVLFNAFNTHTVENLEILKGLFTKDLEFYHDKGGLSNYEQNMKSFAETLQRNSDLKRELIPGTMEVYHLKNFGAMQIGQHRFCHTEMENYNVVFSNLYTSGNTKMTNGK